jgi:hypothetical protein
VVFGVHRPTRSLLRMILDEYSNIFRLKLSAAQAAKFPPMKANVLDDATPIRQRLRRYPPRQTEFLSRYCTALEEHGYIGKTRTTQWIAAPNVVPKQGPAQFRRTVDSRPINGATVPMFWPMPHLDNAIASLHGTKYLAAVDLSAGYYKIAIHVICQDLFAFITPQGAYAPTRLQGSRSAASYFQKCIHNALIDAKHFPSVIQWLDDIYSMLLLSKVYSMSSPIFS